MKLVIPKYHEMETKLIASRGTDKILIENIKKEVIAHKDLLDKLTTRFMDEYGHKLEQETKKNYPYLRFFRSKTAQYAEATRMLRLVNFYESKNV